MQPLINQFTKNLSGCSGCGKSDAVYDAWSRSKQLGGKMKFQLVVVIESDTYKQAVMKVPDEFEILSGGVRPDPKPQPALNLPTVATNMRTGLPVNG